MAIQLKVYESADKLEQYWIDLYETEPIKLTLSIEDIMSGLLDKSRRNNAKT